MVCILPAAYTRNILRGTKFSHELDDILWTDVRDDTHDTDKEDEDDTFDDLPYL